MVPNSMPDGVWPVMLTPFKEDNSIDFYALEALVQWYKRAGVSGLFAACQSSEIFYMTLEERRTLTKAVVEFAQGLPVVTSGHIGGSLENQIYDLNAMADTGVDAVVLIACHMADPTESNDVWKRNTEVLFNSMPAGMPLGLYECPYPYKKTLDAPLLKWCAQTGRFQFLKDTCGYLPAIAEKLKAVEGTQMKLFNANSATLLDSLRQGASGYCGVMANFHPELYVWLCRHPQDAAADVLSPLLSLTSLIEGCAYPVCAKYRLQLEGLPIELTSRRVHGRSMGQEVRLQVEHMRQMEEAYRRMLHL